MSVNTRFGEQGECTASRQLVYSHSRSFGFVSITIVRGLKDPIILIWTVRQKQTDQIDFYFKFRRFF